MTIKNLKLKKTVAIASVLAMALTGRSVETADHDHKAHDHEEHEVGAKSTETSRAIPRVAVATESGVSILDENLNEVESFELPSRPSVSLAHDDRHVVANRQHDNESSIIDAGAWKEGHGDHFHFYTGAPVLYDEVVKGNKPVHVVPNPKADATSIFRR